MATSNTHPAYGEVTSVRHDACSLFDTEGFAIDNDGTSRTWFPMWADGLEPSFIEPRHCDKCGLRVIGRT